MTLPDPESHGLHAINKRNKSSPAISIYCCLFDKVASFQQLTLKKKKKTMKNQTLLLIQFTFAKSCRNTVRAFWVNWYF